MHLARKRCRLDVSTVVIINENAKITVGECRLTGRTSKPFLTPPLQALYNAVYKYIHIFCFTNYFQRGGETMVTVDVIRVREHYELFFQGHFLCSCDTNELKSCYEDAVKSVLCNDF